MQVFTALLLFYITHLHRVRFHIIGPKNISLLVPLETACSKGIHGIDITDCCKMPGLQLLPFLSYC